MRVFIIILCSMVIIPSVSAQNGKRKRTVYSSKKPSENAFLDSQWWLGFKAGTNLTQANPEERFSTFSPINYKNSELDKGYTSFEGLRAQAGLEVTFYHKGFSFSIQPNYRRQQFAYSNDYLWIDPNNTVNQLELHYQQKHELDYVEVPLFIKYDILRGKIRPFVQVGVYYATLVGANKSIVISGADTASGASGSFEQQEIIVGAKELFINSSTGISGGVGVSYDAGNIRLVFDATYRYGLNNITNQKNRFSKNQLTGVGDAMDNITMDNISFNLGFLFPLRFISKLYDAVN